MFTLDNRHALAAPYWARPGIRSFAAPADGGGGKGDEDDDDEDDDDEDDDEDDDPDADKDEETLRAELKQVRAALAGAKGSSKRNLRRRRELEAQLAKGGDKGKPKSKGKGDDDEDDKPDVEAIREQARREGRAEADKVRKADKAELALARAGVAGDAKLKRAVRMLDLDDLDIDDDGTVEGLDDAIAELKSELPELFGTVRKRRSTAGGADRDGDDKAAKSTKGKDASALQAAALLGKSA